MAVCPTRSHWESRSSQPSRTVYVPLRRWSAPCCALWSSLLLCWHEQVCQDPHRCPPSHLQWEITKQRAMKTKKLKMQPALTVCLCSQMGTFKLVWQWTTTQCSCLSKRGAVQRGLRLKLYVFWALQEVAIKTHNAPMSNCHHAKTWRNNTFHCFDIRNFLSTKTERLALKVNHLWLWKMMNTVRPLKPNVFSLSWMISYPFYLWRNRTL